MKHEYRRIPINLIDVPSDRLRSIDQHRVEVLAADIKANGLLQPIGVVEEETGRFTLTFGLHRLTACDLRLGFNEIDARVQPHNWIRPQERRVQEIMENLNREGLTMLQRAESLAALKALHEELHPETKNGGDRKSAKRKNQKEIFSFRSESAEKTGLSVRAINIAVAIVTKLDADVKHRLRGTWLEDHQAGLRLLSEQSHQMQHQICDLLFSTPPQAASVADAIILAEGRRLPSSAEKLLTSVMNNFSKLSDRDRRSVYAAHEDEIRAYAQEKGWL